MLFAERAAPSQHRSCGEASDHHRDADSERGESYKGRGPRSDHGFLPMQVRDPNEEYEQREVEERRRDTGPSRPEQEREDPEAKNRAHVERPPQIRCRDPLWLLVATGWLMHN